MGYVKDSLLPDEELLAYGTPHWYTTIPALVVIAIGTAVALIVGRWWGAAIMIPGGLLLVQALLARLTAESVVTTRRVIVRSGFWRTQTIELEHKNIESFVVEQTLLGRLLNYGTVIVNGIGGAKIPLEGLARPGQFRRAALQAEEHLKLGKGYWPESLENGSDRPDNRLAKEAPAAGQLGQTQSLPKPKSKFKFKFGKSGTTKERDAEFEDYEN